MAWGTKYRTEFENDNNELFQLDIKEEDYVGGITELSSGANPVTIIPTNENYLAPSVGAGMEIILVSETSLQLISLNTVDRFANKVELYQDFVLIWQGWLNPEEYQEVYSEYANYHVSFTANDGLSLLDNIKFAEITKEPFKGITSLFTVIMTALLYTRLDLIEITFADNFTLQEKDGTPITYGATSTYLNKALVNYDNYIDETGEIMSCREVLDGVLLSLGLVLRNNVLSAATGSTFAAGFTIFDTNVIIPEGSINLKTYTFPNIHQSTLVLGVNDFTYDLENDLNKRNTGSTLKFDKAINNQEISFSNYQLIDILEETITPDNLTTVSTKSERSPGAACSDDNRWSEWIYPTIDNFDIIDSSVYPAEEVIGVEGTTATYNNTGDFYLARSKFVSESSANLLFETNVDTPVFYKGFDSTYSDYANLGMLINFDLMLAKDACKDADALTVPNFLIVLKISIGSQEYLINANFGKDLGTVSLEQYNNPETDLLKPEDTRKGILLNFPRTANNVITPDMVTISVTKSHTINTSGITENVRLRFKNFSIQLVHSDSTNDTYQEYSKGTDNVETGTVNALATTFGKEIKLIHGTGTTGGIELGQLMYVNPSVTESYFNLNRIDKGVTIAAVPLILTLEKWLMSKIFSNQYEPAVMISNMSIRASDVEQASFARITDVNQFPNKVFMIMGYVYKPYNNEIIYTLREIKADSYTD